jgi:hypothetical protein
MTPVQWMMIVLLVLIALWMSRPRCPYAAIGGCGCAGRARSSEDLIGRM